MLVSIFFWKFNVFKTHGSIYVFIYFPSVLSFQLLAVVIKIVIIYSRFLSIHEILQRAMAVFGKCHYNIFSIRKVMKRKRVWLVTRPLQFSIIMSFSLLISYANYFIVWVKSLLFYHKSNLLSSYIKRSDPLWDYCTFPKNPFFLLHKLFILLRIFQAFNYFKICPHCKHCEYLKTRFLIEYLFPNRQPKKRLKMP